MGSKGLRYGGLTLFAGLVGVLFCTNPSQEQYQAFATAEAKDYLVDDACTRSLPFVGDSLRDECIDFIQSDRSTPLIENMIARSSDRRNFGLFSLYSTELDLETLMPALPRGWVPSYRIDALGLGTHFLIYRAQAL
jgi:hypothetical protein